MTVRGPSPRPASAFPRPHRLALRLARPAEVNAIPVLERSLASRKDSTRNIDPGGRRRPAARHPVLGSREMPSPFTRSLARSPYWSIPAVPPDRSSCVV